MKKPSKYPSGRVRRVIDEYTEAAKTYGIAEECGYGASVKSAERNFKATETALVNMVKRLERDAAAWRRHKRDTKRPVSVGLPLTAEELATKINELEMRKKHV